MLLWVVKGEIGDAVIGILILVLFDLTFVQEGVGDDVLSEPLQESFGVVDVQAGRHRSIAGSSAEP